MFLTNKTVVYGKLESTPYTPETIADGGGDFNVRVRDITYSFDVAEFRRKIADGTLDFGRSVMGRRQVTVGFSVDMTPAPAVDTEPEWGKLLEACGFKMTAFGSTGISWVPHSDNTHTPITLELEEIEEGAAPDVLRIRVGSAMGNVVFTSGTVGEPVTMTFEFTGSLLAVEDRTDAQRVDPDTFSTVCPPPVLSATANINSIAQDFDTFEVNMNNDVQIWTDPSKATGVKGAYVAAREPTLTLNPHMTLQTNEAWYADLISCGAVHAVAIDLSVPSGIAALGMSAPKAGLFENNPGERNGARTSEKSLLLQKDSGNDVFEVLQGAKA